jgi:hypothetical protein
MDDEDLIIQEIDDMWGFICHTDRDRPNMMWLKPVMRLVIGMVGNTVNLSLEVLIKSDMGAHGHIISEMYEDIDFEISDPRFFDKIRSAMSGWVKKWESGEILFTIEAWLSGAVSSQPGFE